MAHMPKRKPAMTAAQFVAIRKAAKLTQAEAAIKLRVHLGTVRNWEQDRRGISAAMAEHIKNTLAK